MSHRPGAQDRRPGGRYGLATRSALLLTALLLPGGASADPDPPSGIDADPRTALAEVRRLQQENQRLAARLAAAEAELAALRAGSMGAEGGAPPAAPAPAPAAAGLPDWVAEIEARLQAEFEAREAALLARQAEREAGLDARLRALRARLPTPEGGSVTAADARALARQDAAALMRLLEQARGIDNPDLWREVRAAENALHQSQFLLARADSARTVYRTRPGDSLALVSGLFYGDADQWSRLYDANRHVLDDPNRVPPGVTLVVP